MFKKKEKKLQCHTCGETLTEWDIKCSKALGYEKPICGLCIGDVFSKPYDKIRYIWIWRPMCFVVQK